MDHSYAKKLFTSAAIFNFLIVFALIFQIPPLRGVLLTDSYPPTATVFFQITIGLVALCGWAYYKVASDPVKYQPFVMFGAYAKSIFIAVIYYHWLSGNISWLLPMLVTVDLIYVALFYAYDHRKTTS